MTQTEIGLVYTQMFDSIFSRYSISKDVIAKVAWKLTKMVVKENRRDKLEEYHAQFRTASPNLSVPTKSFTPG